MLLSIVIPVYNEEEGIQSFHENFLIPALKKIKGYEIIYVNDGSKDKSIEELTRIARKSTRVRIVNLSRNFGKEIALTAGIALSKGQATIMLDADGQHPPKMINEFLKRWRNGAQVVIGIRTSNQKEGLIKKYGSKLFYKLFNAYSGAEITPHSTDFRLIDQTVRKEFLRMNERNRITRGLIDWLGFDREYVEFESPARLAGTASYRTTQLFKLALNSFVSLSLKPLEILVGIGSVITLLSLIAGCFVIIEQIILKDPLHLLITGSAMLGIFITFLVGLVITAEGILAIYLAHIHTQTQGRPLFVINPLHSKGIDEEIR